MTTPLYLSRLTLNPRTRRVQRELANLYELHRTLMSSFPATLPEGERVLFRVDIDDRTGVPIVLLQSHTAPDWAWLGDPRANGYLLRAPESKLFELAFITGQRLTFHLRANPTVKRWVPSKKTDPDSKLKPIRSPVADKKALDDWISLHAPDTRPEDINRNAIREKLHQEWLERKAAASGFQIIRVTMNNEGNVYGRQPVKTTEDAGEAPEDAAKVPKAHQLTLHAVRFEGVLQVTDPDKLWETVQQGIGPGKGLGFGLLSLAPPR